MKTYAFLNDIFNVYNEPFFVLKNRINISFGENGEEFWQNFFSCEEYHPKSQFIYLFTERQVRFFWDWWKKKDKDTKDILLASLQNFRANNKNNRQRKNMDIIPACYIKYIDHQPKIIPLFFIYPANNIPNNRGKIFFNGDFDNNIINKDDPEELKPTNDCVNRLIDLMGTIRKDMLKIFEEPKDKNNWLFFNGPNYGTPNGITYCDCYRYSSNNENQEKCDEKCPFI